MVKMQQLGHVVGRVGNPGKRVVQKDEPKSELYVVKTVKGNVYVVSDKELILASTWIQNQFLLNSGGQKSLFWKKMLVKYDEETSKDSFYFLGEKRIKIKD